MIQSLQKKCTRSKNRCTRSLNFMYTVIWGSSTPATAVARIDFTRSNVCVCGFTSSCGDLHTILLTTRLLALFSIVHTSSSIHHVSAPYVMMEKTLATYRSSFRCVWISFENQMCHISSWRCFAIATRCRTSVNCPPPASNCEPRYLKCQQFSIWIWLVICNDFWLDSGGLNIFWSNQKFCITLGVLLF